MSSVSQLSAEWRSKVDEQLVAAGVDPSTATSSQRGRAVNGAARKFPELRQQLVDAANPSRR